MKPLALILMSFLPSMAVAHSGHIADVAGAGHDHWVAGAAIGAAVAITLWTALKGKKKDESQNDEQAESEDSSEPQEA